MLERGDFIKFPDLSAKKLCGTEPLTAPDGMVLGRLSDFWSWAHADLVSNTERGKLAEYIVACALEVQNQDLPSWNSCALVSPEGIRIEVKASGYIQSWGQAKVSTLSFGIQPTHSRNPETNSYAGEEKRQSDIYVFCVFKNTDQNTLNPLDVSQWDFYLLPSKVLNEKVGAQKRITLSRLLSIGAEKCQYRSLHDRICSLVRM